MHLTEIEHYGFILMLPYDVAMILETSVSDFVGFLNDKESKVSKAYYTGVLMQEVQMRTKATSEDANPELITAWFNTLNVFKAQLNLQLKA